MKITASKIIAEHFEITDIDGADLAQNNGCCGYCGLSIEKGDHYKPLKFKSTFIDQHFMADPCSPYACLNCDAILNRSPFLQVLSTGVFTTKGAFPFASKANRAYYLLNPPEPPFVMTIQSGKSQHVVWRAPVNHSKSVFCIQLEERTITIRHALFMQAVKAVFALRDKYVQYKQEKDNSKKPKAVNRDNLRALGYSDMKAKDVLMLKRGLWINEMIDNDVITESDIEFLNKLNWGESWLLDTATSESEKNSPLKPENQLILKK